MSGMLHYRPRTYLKLLHSLGELLLVPVYTALLVVGMDGSGCERLDASPKITLWSIFGYQTTLLHYLGCQLFEGSIPSWLLAWEEE